jgi:hypothetical protein
MATLGQSGKVTLLDWAKSIDPNGSVAAVAELLTQTNEILYDMPWIEGNLPTGHRTTIRTGLPSAIWRQLYQGVPPSKSVRAQIEDAAGMLETRAEIDKDLAELNGNSSAFRLSEASSFVEGLNQTFAAQLIYGNSATNPERFTGFAPRYSAISGATNAQNIVDGGGGASAVQTSVWLVCWGPDTVTGFFPKGSPAGIVHEDLGLIDAFDSNTPAGRYRAYADRWQWKCGLTVRDWRYVVRVANVNTTDLLAGTGTQNAQQLIKSMIKAMARIPFMGKGRPVFYANRTVREMLAIQALDKSQNALAIVPGAQQFGNISPGSAGNGTLTFFGVPIRTVDQIVNTEAQVV